MTENAVEQPPVIVTPPPESRLEQLHAMYANAKAHSEAAAAELKTITDALKGELTAAAPGHERISLTGPCGPTLNLAYVESWRIDSKLLKSEDPGTYVRYAKKSGAWRLEAAKGGQ